MQPYSLTQTVTAEPMTRRDYYRRHRSCLKGVDADGYCVVFTRIKDPVVDNCSNTNYGLEPKDTREEWYSKAVFESLFTPPTPTA